MDLETAGKSFITRCDLSAKIVMLYPQALKAIIIDETDRGVRMKNLLFSFKISSVLFGIVVVGLLSASNVFGGALIHFEATDLEAPPGEIKGVGRMSAYTGNSILKFENDMNNREEWSTMIFHKKKQILELYDHQNKEKRVMDEKSAMQMKQKMQGFQSQMDEMMKNMTPDQRAMMEQMGRGRGTPPPAGLRDNPGEGDGKIIKTRKREKVMRLPCAVYEAYNNAGEKEYDLCVTDLGNIPDGKAVKNLMSELGAFYKKIMSSMTMGQRGQRGPFEMFSRVDGFPLKTTHYENGKPVEVTTLTSVKKASFRAEDFNPFPDYPAVGMMEGRSKMRKMDRPSRMPKRPEGMDSGVPGGSMSPPPGFQIPGQSPGQPLDLQKLLEGLQQRR